VNLNWGNSLDSILNLIVFENMTKVISGTILVAGTSIGAAMIAMPITGAKVGFIGSLVLIFIVGFVMYYMSQINLEIIIADKKHYNITTIVGNVIGKKTQIIYTISILGLLMSLLVAYIAGVGEIISTISTINYINVVLSLGVILFISVSISHKLLDYYNKFAFSCKLLVVAVMTVIISPNITVDNLIMSSHSDINNLSILTVMPIFVTSFGFHGSIPFIYKLLDKDISSYRQATAYGSIITTLVYVLWFILTFGVINYGDLIKSTAGLSDFILLFKLNSTLLSNSINAFALLGIFTSLFGVAVGIYDFIEGLIMSKNRIIIASITFICPTLLCLFGKNLFIAALGYAGCALVIIAIIIPVITRFKLGGKINIILLAFSFFIGILTIVGELIKLWY